MEENMLFQHKKLQTYHNIPALRETEDGDNGDGFGGGFGGGDGGCREMMGQVMEVQSNQYSDVKREVDRIKSMLNNIYALLQESEDEDEEEEENPSVQVEQRQKQRPKNEKTSQLPSKKSSIVKSPSFSESIPPTQTIPVRRGSVPASPTEMSSLLKDIQELVKTQEMKIQSDQKTSDQPPFQLSPPPSSSNQNVGGTFPKSRGNPLLQPGQQQSLKKRRQLPFNPLVTAKQPYQPQGGYPFPPSFGNLQEMTHLSASVPHQPTTELLYPPLNNLNSQHSVVDMLGKTSSVKPRQPFQPSIPLQRNSTTSPPSAHALQQQQPPVSESTSFSVGSEAVSTSTLNNLPEQVSFSDLSKSQLDSPNNTPSGTGRRRRRKKKSSVADVANLLSNNNDNI